MRPTKLLLGLRNHVLAQVNPYDLLGIELTSNELEICSGANTNI